MSKKAAVAAGSFGLIGGVAGVMIGGLFGGYADAKTRRGEDDESMVLTGMGAVVGGVLGAVVSATIGAGTMTPADPPAGALPSSTTPTTTS
jgi:hypothetical protein